MKKYFYVFLILLFLLLPNTNAKKVSCSSSEYTANIEFNDKIGINHYSNIKVTSNTPYNVNYKTNEKDILLLQDNGLIKGLKEGVATVVIEIEFINNSLSTSTCRVEQPISVVSSDSSLKSLSIDAIDISSIFSPSNYEYNLSLPYKNKEINISAQANSESATISNVGKIELNVGVNNINIIVTASDNTTSTYKLNITRMSPNNDGTLKSLVVDGFILSPNFNKDIRKYSINVDKNIDEINIKGIPNFENAEVEGTGKFKVATGKNIYTIKVTAEDGSIEKYDIEVNKNKGSSRLKKLEVINFPLNEKFNSYTYTYHTTVTHKINSLEIIAEAFDNDQIEIVDNENFEVGENEVIIKVTGEDKTITTYKIIVYKLSKDAEKSLQRNNLLLKILLYIFIVALLFTTIFIYIFINRNYKVVRVKKRLKKIKNKKRKKK